MKKTLIILATAMIISIFSSSLAIGFYDIDDGNVYKEGIAFLKSEGIVNGYPDGNYGPWNSINRAELLKIVVEAFYDSSEFDPFENQTCFTDVSPGEWFTKYVCFANYKGIVEGYEDGNFRPAQEINFVEALKITTKTSGYTYTEGTSPWYLGIVNSASEKNFIPLDITSFAQYINRAQMADMITRVLKYQNNTLYSYLGTSISKHHTYTDIQNAINNIIYYWQRSYPEPTPIPTPTPTPEPDPVYPINPQNDPLDTFQDDVDYGAGGYVDSYNPWDGTIKTYLDDTAEYRKSNGIIEVVCEAKCPIPVEILDAKYEGVLLTVEALKDLFNAEFSSSILPIRVHLNVDSYCSQNFLDTTGTGFFGYDFEDGGTHLCIYSYEKTIKQTFATPLNVETSSTPSEVLTIHELTHALLKSEVHIVNELPKETPDYDRINTYYNFEEVIAKAASFNIVRPKTSLYYTDTLCENKFDNYLVDLCNNYGLDYDDFPEIYRMLSTSEPWFNNLKEILDGEYRNHSIIELHFLQEFYYQLLGVRIPIEDWEEYITRL